MIFPGSENQRTKREEEGDEDEYSSSTFKKKVIVLQQGQVAITASNHRHYLNIIKTLY